MVVVGPHRAGVSRAWALISRPGCWLTSLQGATSMTIALGHRGIEETKPTTHRGSSPNTTRDTTQPSGTGPRGSCWRPFATGMRAIDSLFGSPSRGNPVRRAQKRLTLGGYDTGGVDGISKRAVSLPSSACRAIMVSMRTGSSVPRPGKGSRRSKASIGSIHSVSIENVLELTLPGASASF